MSSRFQELIREYDVLDGWMEEIRDGTAYFSLKDPEGGPRLELDGDAAPFIASGVEEGDRFQLKITTRKNGERCFDLAPRARYVPTDEEIAAIRKKIDEVLPPDETIEY